VQTRTAAGGVLVGEKKKEEKKRSSDIFPGKKISNIFEGGKEVRTARRGWDEEDERAHL